MSLRRFSVFLFPCFSFTLWPGYFLLAFFSSSLIFFDTLSTLLFRPSIKIPFQFSIILTSSSLVNDLLWIFPPLNFQSFCWLTCLVIFIGCWTSCKKMLEPLAAVLFSSSSFFLSSSVQCFEFFSCTPPLQNLSSELFCSEGYITARIFQRDHILVRTKTWHLKGRILRKDSFFWGWTMEGGYVRR